MMALQACILLLLLSSLYAEKVPKSIEVNPDYEGEALEFLINNGQVDTLVTLCYRVLHKHLLRMYTSPKTLFRLDFLERLFRFFMRNKMYKSQTNPFFL